MADVMIILILVLAVGSACLYIHRSNKKGIKCVGCPYAASCATQETCTGSTNVEEEQRL